MQLYGPSRWKEKFAAPAPTSNVAIRAFDDPAPTHLDAEQLELERRIGNWASAIIRRTSVLVEASELRASVERILDHIKEASGQRERKLQLFIIASPEVNALALPNGDVFVCSGLLEVLATKDELAAALGHVLDHVFQHDAMYRLERTQKARAATRAALVLAAIGLRLMGPLMPGAGTTAALGSQVAAQLSLLGILLGGGMIGEAIGVPIAFGFSADRELRADYHSFRYVAAAGYEPRAQLDLLLKLKDLKAAAELEHEPVVSELINAPPGLEERIEAMLANIERRAIAVPAAHRPRTRGIDP